MECEKATKNEWFHHSKHYYSLCEFLTEFLNRWTKLLATTLKNCNQLFTSLKLL